MAIDPSRIGVLHLHHLAFGATPALIRALPSHPRMALVHGTDLIFSEAHRDQLQVLRETARAADAIMVPTGAKADHLPRGYFLDEFELPPRQSSSSEKAHPSRAKSMAPHVRIARSTARGEAPACDGVGEEGGR